MTAEYAGVLSPVSCEEWEARVLTHIHVVRDAL